MTDAGPGGARRVFLGWDAAVLPRAADWLLAEFGNDLAHVVVALPGSRAVRRLEVLLVERAAARGLRELSPPRLTTAGHLGDVLLLPPCPAAGRLQRTLHWCEALATLEPGQLGRLFREPPAPDERSAWLAYAEELRAVHATLAAEGRDFAAVADALPGVFGAACSDPSAQAEIARWRALAQVQAAYRLRLDTAGRCDPHAGRWAALNAREFAAEFTADARKAGHVVLVGVVELNALTRRLLDVLGRHATALIAAPESEREAFDALGAAHTAAWFARPLPLERATWSVVETPDAQAVCALALLDDWVARDGAAADVTCGVPDESVTPFLERRLAQRGVTARPGTAGTFRVSPAGTLLAALHDLLATGEFRALATLARHPAMFAALARHPALAGRDPLALLDAAQAEHLPGRVCGPGVPRGEGWPTLVPVLAALQQLLGELLSGPARTWSEWAAPIRDALASIFGDAMLVAEAPDTHATHASLAVLAAALDELVSLPKAGAHGPDGADAVAGSTSAWCGEVEAREALALLLRSYAGNEVPPRADRDAVDLLGWLEVPLDESPDLLLTGFNAGSLPAAPGSAIWLPERLREALTVPGERERVARDACLLTLVLHSRARVALISGRVGNQRDPLLPSPLSFHVPDDDVPARVRTWLSGSAGMEPVRGAPEQAKNAAPGSGPGARALPRLLHAPPTRGVSVTALRSFLSSPYRYYLERVLRLQRAQDDAHELDPRGFGTLAHAVLQAFGENRVARDSDDEAVVRAALHGALDARARARFGPRPLPAVGVQIEQLRYRLTRFAGWQAGAAHEGWRIAEVEWAPKDPVMLDVDGEGVVLRGRIDRIDVHTDGRRWRVLDYKTGDEVRAPDKTHRAGDGTWRDLQLPLYALLVQSFATHAKLTEPPGLGYLALPREDDTDCALLAPWNAADLQSAHAAARSVIARILAGEFFEVPDRSLDDLILDAIAGQGLLESAPQAEAQA